MVPPPLHHHPGHMASQDPGILQLAWLFLTAALWRIIGAGLMIKSAIVAFVFFLKKILHQDQQNDK